MFVGHGSTLPPLEEPSTAPTGEKELIAKAAAARIDDGDAMLLDGGTTTLEVAKLLVNRHVQVVTNSLPIAQLLASSRETDLILTGGCVYPQTGVGLRPLTRRRMRHTHVHHSASGV